MPTPRKYGSEAERKRAYRERKKAEEAAKAAGVPAPSAPATSPAFAALIATNPNRRVLEGIRDDPDSLDSDKIRATQELAKIDAAERENGPSSGASELVALRRVIEALPVGERVAWLRDEKNQTAAERGHTSEGGS